MDYPRRRVALNLDLELPYKRHAALFAGTQQYARQKGWESIIDEFVAENLPERSTKPLPYDGVIARVNDKLYRRATALGLPVVNVWYSSPIRAKVPGVFPDFAASGKMKAEHLLARGFRRFASIYRGDRARRLESNAFRATVEAAGFRCVETKIPLHMTQNHSTWLKSQKVIDMTMNDWQPPIGISANDESVGRMILQMCGKRQWLVPQDVAVVAGWNEEVLCNDPQPSLTSAELGFEQIGYAAASMLDKLIDQKNAARNRPGTPPPNKLIPPQAVIVRDSTDFYAVEDTVVAAALQFIAQHSHTNIDPDDVARAVAIEPRTLRRRFDKELGRPIIREICRVRIERAKRELVQSNRSLDAIAHDVGFGTGRQMRDVFCRELGITPREYRKQRQLDIQSTGE